MFVIRFNINGSEYYPLKSRCAFHMLSQVVAVSLNSINRFVSVKETRGVLCELELKFYI